MEQLVFRFGNSDVNQIRSYISTIRAYYQASIALHRRPTESVFVAAAALGDKVDAIEMAYPGDVEIARWATKFRQIVKDFGLDEPRSVD